MSERIEALINPSILSWARVSAGLDLEKAAHKVGVRPERLQSWETGERRPTINQLRKLSHVFRRPIAVFYLPEAPSDIKLPRDFRKLPGHFAREESPELRFEIRRAAFRRDVALELIDAENEETPALQLSTSEQSDPENAAQQIRVALNLQHEEPFAWKTPHESFNHWRARIEGIGVLVLQMTDVPLVEARGFSISEFPLPVVVVNIKDAPRGRTFSLLHELAHVMLRQDALCDLDDTANRGAEDLRVERFCNAVAGAALIPRDYLLSDHTVRAHGTSEEWADEELDALSRRFAASREAVLRRLLDLGKTTVGFYRLRRQQFLEEYEETRRARDAGFAPPHLIALASAGPSLTGLVLTGYAHGHITAADVSDVLGIRLKHLPRLQRQLMASERQG